MTATAQGKRVFVAAWSIIFLLMPVATLAQTDKPLMVIDRPDQSNTPTIIPKGSLQVETGFMMERDNNNSPGQTNFTYNNTLIKYGVNNFFELRLNAVYLGMHRVPSESPSATGFGPIALGFKIKLADAKGFMPQAAIASHINIKTGAKEFSPNYTTSDLTVLFCHEIGKKWSLTYNGGVKWTGDTPEAVFLYTLSVSYLMGKAELFAETYSFFPEQHKANHRMDWGIIFTLAPTVQFDIAGGIGLSKNAPNYFLGTGLSIRLFK